jgi:bacterioferritin-associated ferredoxin
MIVCSCNVLTDKQVLATLESEKADRPRSPGQVYRCLGCKPSCGRCLIRVRQLLEDARHSECEVGCATCPAAAHSDWAAGGEARPQRISVPVARRFRGSEPQPGADVMIAQAAE